VFGWWFGGLIILGAISGVLLTSARREIRARLDRLTPEGRTEALTPFVQSAGQVSAMNDIISPFLRDVARTAELTPATAPSVHGSEPTPAERAP